MSMPLRRALSKSARQGPMAALSSETSLPSDSPKPPGSRKSRCMSIMTMAVLSRSIETGSGSAATVTVLMRWFLGSRSFASRPYRLHSFCSVSLRLISRARVFFGWWRSGLRFGLAPSTCPSGLEFWAWRVAMPLEKDGLGAQLNGVANDVVVEIDVLEAEGRSQGRPLDEIAHGRVEVPDLQVVALAHLVTHHRLDVANSHGRSGVRRENVHGVGDGIVRSSEVVVG